MRLTAAIIISGILGAMIYPTVIFGKSLQMGFVAWVSLVPLLLALRSRSGFKAFFVAFLSQALTFSVSLYWLVFAMKNFGGLSFTASLGVLALMVVILSAYYALGLLAALWVWRKGGLPWILSIPVFFVIIDFARSHFPVEGFSWSMAAYSQGEYLTYFQWLDVTGVYGLNFLIYLVNTLIAEAFSHGLSKASRLKIIHHAFGLFLAVALSIAASIYRQRAVESPAANETTHLMALVQGNISQEVKWDPRQAANNLKTHLDLTEKAQFQGAELSIWPESGYPYALDLSDIRGRKVIHSDSIHIPILFGAVSERPVSPALEPLIYNSSFLVDREGRVLDFYHKRHLVPYGEYVPFRQWLKFARKLTVGIGDFTEGREATPLDLGQIRYGNLICYEDIFPELARATVLRGANLLVNLTNDAWYGVTSAPYQHVVYSQIRALENRRYLARATNTGITAIVDYRGEVISSLKPFSEGVLTGSLSTRSLLSPYTQWGDVVVWASVAAALFGLGLAFIRSRGQYKK